MLVNLRAARGACYQVVIMTTPELEAHRTFWWRRLEKTFASSASETRLRVGRPIFETSAVFLCRILAHSAIDALSANP